MLVPSWATRATELADPPATDRHPAGNLAERMRRRCLSCAARRGQRSARPYDAAGLLPGMLSRLVAEPAANTRSVRGAMASGTACAAPVSGSGAGIRRIKKARRAYPAGIGRSLSKKAQAVEDSVCAVARSRTRKSLSAIPYGAPRRVSVATATCPARQHCRRLDSKKRWASRCTSTMNISSLG